MGKTHTSYPLQYLADGDPNTAWVFSGLKTFSAESIPSPYSDRQFIRIESDRPISVDQIRIMNGYNKSAELFRKNDRITGIEIWNGNYPETRLAKAELPDAMGWHRIRFKRLKTNSLVVKFTKLAPGDIRDLCVSELRLFNSGTEIPFRLPAALLSSKGSECGCGSSWNVVSRTDALIMRSTGGERPEPLLSKSGKAIVGYDDENQKVEIWVVDTRKGQVVHRYTVVRQKPGQSRVYVDRFEWESTGTLLVGIRALPMPELGEERIDLGTTRIKFPAAIVEILK